MTGIIARCLRGLVGATLLLPAAAALSSGLDTADSRLAEALRLRFGATASLVGTSRLEGDVTCDGRPDLLAGYLDRDGPEGPRLAILLLPAGAPAAQAEMASLPFADRQIALCGDAAALPLSLEVFDQEEADSLFGRGVCRRAVRVEDPLCDAPRLFYAPDAPLGARLLVFRN